MTCDEVAILNHGNIVKQGKIVDLLKSPTTVKMRIINMNSACKTALQSLSQSVEWFGEDVAASIECEDVIPDLVNVVMTNNARLMSLIPVRESLEDLFVRVVDNESAA